jgi:NADPH2:quinone reductase
MRAVQVQSFGGPEGLAVAEVPAPAPGPGEVLIAARAIGVNYPDLLVAGGKYQRLPPLPFSPGKELAGIVAAVGEGVTSCRPGDRVMAQVEHGAYAEEVVASAAQCFVMPDGMSFAEGAAMGLVYQTAWFALLDRGLYREGETVLVLGAAGGVGLAALQLAKALGATVLAGVSRPERAAALQGEGADRIIELWRPNLRDSLREQVHAATAGRGADVALDPAGGDVFDAALRALAWRGRLVVIGFAAGRIPEVRANYLLLKNISVSGLQWSDYRDRTPDWMRQAQDELFALWRAGRLKPRIADALPLEEAATALRRLQEGSVVGKLVLTVGNGG